MSKLWFRRSRKINFPSKLVNNNAFVLKEWSAGIRGSGGKQYIQGT